jgi:hypothetical protein
MLSRKDGFIFTCIFLANIFTKQFYSIAAGESRAKENFLKSDNRS